MEYLVSKTWVISTQKCYLKNSRLSLDDVAVDECRIRRTWRETAKRFFQAGAVPWGGGDHFSLVLFFHSFRSGSAHARGMRVCLVARSGSVWVGALDGRRIDSAYCAADGAAP